MLQRDRSCARRLQTCGKRGIKIRPSSQQLLWREERDVSLVRQRLRAKANVVLVLKAKADAMCAFRPADNIAQLISTVRSISR